MISRENCVIIDRAEAPVLFQFEKIMPQDSPPAYALTFPIHFDLGQNGGKVAFSTISDASDWANQELGFWEKVFSDQEDAAYKELALIFNERLTKASKTIASSVNASKVQLDLQLKPKTEVLNRLHDQITSSLREYHSRQAIHRHSPFAEGALNETGNVPRFLGMLSALTECSSDVYSTTLRLSPEVVRRNFHAGRGAGRKLLENLGVKKKSELDEISFDSLESRIVEIKKKNFPTPTISELRILFGKIKGLDEFRLKRTQDTDLNNAIQRLRTKIQEQEEKLIAALPKIEESTQQSLNRFYNRAFVALNYISESSNDEYDEEIGEYKKEIYRLLDICTSFDGPILDAFLRVKIDDTEKKLDQATIQADAVERLAHATQEVATDIVKTKIHKTFHAAALGNLGKAVLFFFASTALISCMFFYIFDFLSATEANIGMPELWRKTILRFTLLASLGTIAAIFLGLMKSQLHMREHNLHRQRLLDLAEVLREIARTDDQKDMVLQTLVSSISTFGSSGIIAGEASQKESLPNLTAAFNRLSASQRDG